MGETLVRVKRGDKRLLRRKICYVEAVNRWVEIFYFGSYVEPRSATYTKMPPLQTERYCQATWAPCKYARTKGDAVYCMLPLLAENKEIRECFLAFLEAYNHNRITATGGESLRNVRKEFNKLIEDYLKEVKE